MPHFDALKIQSCRKHCEKRRNCLLQAISPFLTMFSTLFSTYFYFQMHFKMSSASCSSLDQSKILSSGVWLIIHCTWNALKLTHDSLQIPFSYFHDWMPLPWKKGICKRLCIHAKVSIFIQKAFIWWRNSLQRNKLIGLWERVKFRYISLKFCCLVKSKNYSD